MPRLQDPIDEMPAQEPIDEVPIDETPVQSLPQNVPEENIPRGDPLIGNKPVELNLPPRPGVMTPSHNQEQNRGFAHQVFDAAADKFNQTGIGQAWQKVNTPVTTLGFGDKGMMPEARQMFREEHPYIAKPFDFAIDTMNTLATPLNIGTAGVSGLEAKTGSAALGALQKLMQVPVGIEGTVNMLSPHSTPAERMAGALELWGAKRGLASKIQVPAKDTPAIPVSQVSEALNADDFIFKNYIKNIGQVKEGQPHRIVLDTISPEIVQKLSDLGYSPAGSVLEDGPYKGRLYMAKAPPPIEVPKPKGPLALLNDFWNLPRGMTTTADLSAPFRQGAPMIGFRAWWTSWDDMLKAFGSENSYNIINKTIDDDPLFHNQRVHAWKDVNGVPEWLPTEQPSVAKKAGLAIYDKEEGASNAFVEKYVPLGARSNRAYNMFMRKLRADSFKSVVESQKAIVGRELTDAEYKQIATAINDLSGKGKLTTRAPGLRITDEGTIRPEIRERGLGNIQGGNELANLTFFSPRLMASRIRMLNPLTYTDPSLSPLVRRQYLKAAISQATLWGVMVGLGSLKEGQQTSFNPLNADFMKLKYGNLRIDPGAGFQQFMVAYTRMLTGLTTSSVTGNTREFGQGYNAPTWGENALNAGSNKLNPLLKFGYDLAFASEYHPVQVGDRVVQMFVPLVAQDMIELAKDTMKPGHQKDLPPEMAAALLSIVGVGSQMYGVKGETENLIWPPQYDYTHKGGMPPGMEFALGHLPVVGSRIKSELGRRRTR